MPLEKIVSTKNNRQETLEWGKTAIQAREAVGAERIYEERRLIDPVKKLYFDSLGAKRRVIGVDAPINQGIQITFRRVEDDEVVPELIVVDDQQDAVLNQAYEALQPKLMGLVKGRSFRYEQNVLTAVYDLTREKIPYDRQKLNQIVSNLDKRGVKTQEEGFFLGELMGEELKGGSCRHQSLLAA